MLQRIQKSAPYRKSAACFLTPYRMLAPQIDSKPPILCDSLPKSGTHLLLQIARSLPQTDYYYRFFATTPSVTLKERPAHAMAKRLKSMRHGEIVPAHLFYDEQLSQVIAERGIKHLFIYRDPRDVIVSEVHYLSRMTPWHRLSRRFKQMTFDEGIQTAIEGIPQIATYPNIGARLRRQIPWLTDPHTYPVRFEDLISQHSQRKTIEGIVQFSLSKNQSKPLDRDIIHTLTNQAIAAIKPENSHTFRNGKCGNWRHTFKAKHTKRFLELAGEELHTMQYSS